MRQAMPSANVYRPHWPCLDPVSPTLGLNQKTLTSGCRSAAISSSLFLSAEKVSFLCVFVFSLLVQENNIGQSRLGHQPRSLLFATTYARDNFCLGLAQPLVLVFEQSYQAPSYHRVVHIIAYIMSRLASPRRHSAVVGR